MILKQVKKRPGSPAFRDIFVFDNHDAFDDLFNGPESYASKNQKMILAWM
jgi:hypothetical protein